MSIYNPRGKVAKDVHDVIMNGGGKFADKHPRVIYKKDMKGKARQVVRPSYYNPHASYGPRTRKTGNKNLIGNSDNGGIPGVGAGPGNVGDEIWRREGDGSGGKEGGEGEQEPIYVHLPKDDLKRFFSGLELELVKPGKMLKRVGYNWAVVADHGPKSTFDLAETVYAAVQRQTLWYPNGEFDVCGIEEPDLRYRIPHDIIKKDKDAVVVFIRDVSGSISDEELIMSYELTEKVEYWLHESYHGKVQALFVPHNHFAWEETREGYYDLASGGGTFFGSAYELILNAIAKKDYERRPGVRRKEIDPETTDVYAIHMTDGFDGSAQISLDFLGRLLPSLTRFCYLETSFVAWASYGTQFTSELRSGFREYYNRGAIRIAKASSIEDVTEAIRVFFGKVNH